MQNLTSFLNEIRCDSDVLLVDEAKVKQRIILPVLYHLGWDIFKDIEPEVSVKGGRVDYGIKIQNVYKVFIEAKKPSEDPSRHQEQLLDYSFKAGIELAIITNGITWLMFLPLKPGSWEQRKFYTIDIREQEPVEVAKRFSELLSKECVSTGQAIKNAGAILEDQRRQTTIKDILPLAWDKLLASSDEYLLDLVCEYVEKLCGYRPDYDAVEDFLNTYRASRPTNTEVSRKSDLVPLTERRRSTAPLSEDDDMFKKKPNSFSFDGKVYRVSKWREILVQLCNILYQKSPSQFQQLIGWRGTVRYYFHSDPTQMDMPERIATTPTPIYVETKWSGRDIVRFCRQIIERFGYKQSDIKVEYS